MSWFLWVSPLAYSNLFQTKDFVVVVVVVAIVIVVGCVREREREHRKITFENKT
jgi:hypothetical protein